MIHAGTILAVAAIATLFATGFVYKQPGADFFAHYAVIPVLFLVGFALSMAAFSWSIAALLGALLLHSAWSIAVHGNSFGSAAQQLVGIAATLATFYYVFRLNGFDTTKLFSIYLRGCVVVGAIGLFQLLSFAIDFRAGYDLAWFMPEYHLQLNQLGILRVQSLMLEPAHLGIVVSAGIFVAVLRATGGAAHLMPRWHAVVILAAAVATFSSVAYAAILVSLALAALHRGQVGALLGGVAVAAACLLLYNLVPDVRVRVDDSVALLLYQNVATANLSSLTLYNNAHVAWESLLATDLFGGGLGSHPRSFERFSLLYGMSELPLRYAMLNNADASALVIRIASELGVPGLAAAAVFLARYYVPSRAVSRSREAFTGPGDAQWIISNAALVFLLMSLLRQGHYFNYGLPFFGLLYLEAGRSNRVLARFRRSLASAGLRP